LLLPTHTRTARAARAERAAATRARIVDAAVPLFVEHGYLETTMAGIARAAGVAVQTLYLSFGSKVAVLEAALGAGPPDGVSRCVSELAGESDGPSALRKYTTATAELIERRYPLEAALRAAAADPEPAEMLDRTRRAAFALHSAAVDELSEQPGFTTRISVQQATEIGAALLSPESYGLLVVGHGWSTAEWAEWVARHLTVDLFPATVRAQPSPR
jgi:AcrR family transcriptional regulator